MDMEKVKKGIKACWSEYFSHKCYDCPYKDIRGENGCVKRLGEDVLELLKEQEAKPDGKCVNECECWDSAYERGKQDALKEREEETTFIYDDCMMPMCEKCGFLPFAGYIPDIKWMKERGYIKCPHCGRLVRYE